MYKDETSAVRSHQQGLCISNACNKHTNTCRNTCNHALIWWPTLQTRHQNHFWFVDRHAQIHTNRQTH